MRLGFFGRTIVRSVIGFVIVIAAIIMITRATQRAVYDCLLIAQTNDATTEYMWDLTHNNIQSRTVPPLPIIQSHTAESLSPDNQHLAYIDPNPVNPNGPPLLGIQTFPSALTQEQSFGFYSTVYGGN